MSARIEKARTGERDLSLGQLVFSLAIVGGIVYAVAGLPRVPDSLPSMPQDLESQIELLILSPTPDQLYAAIQLLGWVFWLAWAFVAATTLLRIAVVLAVQVAEGAAWVRSLRWLSNLLTLPFIRRAVDTSMAGAILLRVAFVAPSAPVAEAAPIAAQVDEVDGPSTHPATAASSMIPPDEPPDLQPGDVLHVVRYGETLISISRHYFGDDDHWKQIYADNRHRPQPHHGSLDDAGKIYEDWVLVIHKPTAFIQFDADGQPWHTVRKGESLWDIADAVYDDGERWPDLYAANVGLEYRGYVLTDPNVVQPGMRLKLVGLGVQSVEPAPGLEPDPAPAAESPAAVDEAPAAAPTSAPVEPAPTADISRYPPAAAPTTVAVPTVTPVAIAASVPLEEQASPPLSPAASAPAPPDNVVALRDAMPSWAPEAAGAAAGVALIGLGLAGIGRRRRRRSPWDETDILVAGGFAEATGGDEAVYEGQAATLADQVLTCARQHGCADVQLRGIYAGRGGARLVLTVAAAQADQLVTAASAFGPAPSTVRLKPSDDGNGDYEWEQAWGSLRPLPVGSAPSAPVRLLPLGLAGDRRVLYADRSASGTLLVAGRASAGVHELLAGLVVDRARRQRPDELYLLTIAQATRLEPLLTDVPHQRAGFVNPDDTAAVGHLLEELRAELERRLQHGQGVSPDLLLVVDEWAELADQGPVLDLIARHGPALGVCTLAATTRIEDPTIEKWIGLFGTRLVLSTPDEASSVRLLGEAGAEDLDSVGQLWPMVHGSILHGVRGFRVPPLHLADLVQQMRRRAVPLRDEVPSALRDIFGSDTDDDHVDAGSVGSSAGVALDDVLEQDDSRPAASDGPPPHPNPDAQSPSPAAPAPFPSPTTPHAAPSVSNGLPAHQLPLIGAVAMPRGPSAVRAHVTVADAEQHVAEPAVGERLVELFLFGNRDSLVRGQALTQERCAALTRFRRAWHVVTAIAALPEARASVTTIGALLWSRNGDDGAAVAHRIESHLFNVRQLLQAAGLSKADVHQIVRTDAGICLLDRNRVRVDVWDFLDAQRTGNHARAAGRRAEAMAAYQCARTLYAGPLLEGQDAGYPWLHERVADGLTLRESYHGQWRQLTERLAELLVAAGRHAEAAPLYQQLLLDRGALPSRDRDLAETREAHALALFGCSRALGDAAGLEQAFQDLQLALERDDVDGAATTPTRPGPETLAILEEARQELRIRTVSPTGRAGDPPAAAGD